jgi:hypothetical protein
MKPHILIFALPIVFAACGDKPADEAVESAQPVTSMPAETETAEMPVIERTASVEGAKVFFITPADGATVANPISIEFGIAGMDVVKAGNDQANSGHHHLLIDTDLPDLGLPIPADEHHVHFGDGSTSTQISLPPGEHKLQMLLGDYLHIPHNPPLTSAQITITVE